MIVNQRYLEASVFSFCIHAVIFLYLYGSFNSNTSQTILISQPLKIELKFGAININGVDEASRSVVQDLLTEREYDVR